MARKKKPIFGPSSYKKNPRKNAPDVTQKGPINTQNVKNLVGREENVFFSLDVYPIITYI